MINVHTGNINSTGELQIGVNVKIQSDSFLDMQNLLVSCTSKNIGVGSYKQGSAHP